MSGPASAPGDSGRLYTAAGDTISVRLHLPGRVLSAEVPRVYVVAGNEEQPHRAELLFGPVDADDLPRVAGEAAALIGVELAPSDVTDIVAGIAPGQSNLARRTLPGPPIGYLLSELAIRGSTENVATVTIRLSWDPVT